MEILVCLKRVPELAEAELEPAGDGRSIRTEGLIYELNEWDAYALEWALGLAEETGGRVTAMCLGGEAEEDVLFRALAMGAEKAVRLEAESLDWADPALKTAGLAAKVAELKPDLVLTGVQSADLGRGQTGVRLAQALGWPHASMIIKLEGVSGRTLTLRRELEGGWEERLEIDLPAVLTIQTNPNPPRYVSVLGIRKARQKPLDVQAAAIAGEPGLELLGLTPHQRVSQVEFLSEDADEAAESIAAIIRERS